MVSIVMPIFNRANVVEITFNSILDQTYADWECIVVDDGSTDNTITILKDLSNNDSRFKILERPKDTVKGAPSCRNIGIQIAKGDYILFLDSDDTLEPHCLASRVNVFQLNPNENFLVFPMGICTNGNVIKKEITTVKTFLIDFLSYKLPWSIMCPLWKADFIKSLNGFKEGYPRLNDPELMIRALLIPDVNFKVFNDVPYDTVYYPSVSNWVLMIDKYYNSLQLFIPDISNELEKRGQLELKKNLRGYLKIWYRDFFFPSNKNLITQNKNLIKLFRENSIITLRTSLILIGRFYIFIFLSYVNRKIKNSQIANLG